jgi:hypothetical protein
MLTKKSSKVRTSLSVYRQAARVQIKRCREKEFFAFSKNVTSFVRSKAKVVNEITVRTIPHPTNVENRLSMAVQLTNLKNNYKLKRKVSI